MRCRPTILGWGLLLGIAACGGSGGGESAAAAGLLRGRAVTPDGRLSKMVTGATAASGLVPVADANVFLFSVDRAGNPAGPAVASTRTDADGRFAFQSKPEFYGDGLMVQVTAADAPAPVGLVGGGTLNSPVTGDDLIIDPASEHASREIVRRMRGTPGTSLAAFTREEAASFVSYVQTLFNSDLSNLLQSTTESTIERIARSLSPELVSDVLDGLDDPSQAAVPSGTYHFVDYYGQYDSDSHRYSGSGTFTIAPGTGRVTLTSQGTSMRRGYTRPGAFVRAYATATAAEGPVTRAGVVTKGTNGFLLFTLEADATHETETVLGSATGSGDVIVFTINEKIDGVGRAGIRVSTRDGISMSVSTLNGDYGFSAVRCTFPADGLYAPPWPGLQITIQTGRMQFLPIAPPLGQVGILPLTHNPMELLALPDPFQPPSDCTLAGVVPAPTPTPAVPPASLATYTVGPDGLTDLMQGPVVTQGRLSPTGSLLVLRDGVGSNDIGLTLGVPLAPSGKTNASLAGRFNFTQIEDGFGAPNALAQGGARTGIVEFGADGSLRIIGGNIGQTRRTCVGGDPTSAGIRAESNYDAFDSPGVFLLLEEPPAGSGVFRGTLSVFANSYGPYPFVGYLSADDSVLVMSLVVDSPNLRSIRSLVIGTRQ